MAIVWSEEYALGIPSIDAQHRGLIEIIAQLSENLRSEESSESVMNGVVQKLVDYARDHFSYEEERLAECAYGESESHHAEHGIFIKRMQDFQERCEKSLDSWLAVELLGFLEGWLMHHIMFTDRRYVETFKAHGIQ